MGFGPAQKWALAPVVLPTGTKGAFAPVGEDQAQRGDRGGHGGGALAPVAAPNRGKSPCGGL